MPISIERQRIIDRLLTDANKAAARHAARQKIIDRLLKDATRANTSPIWYTPKGQTLGQR